MRCAVVRRGSKCAILARDDMEKISRYPFTGNEECCLARREQ
jgi:hypothetical protein